jgi:hypothetical protein
LRHGGILLDPAGSLATGWYVDEAQLRPGDARREFVAGPIAGIALQATAEKLTEVRFEKSPGGVVKDCA